MIEAVAIGRLIEERERPKARERMERNAGGRPSKNPHENLVRVSEPEKVAPHGRQYVTEMAAAAVGMSDYKYRQAKKVAAEFGSSRLRLPREERQEVVASLRESGLSIRAIEAATGLGRGTVERELRSGVPSGTPDDEPKVVGTDGKTYSPRPPSTPLRPKRPPLVASPCRLSSRS